MKAVLNDATSPARGGTTSIFQIWTFEQASNSHYEATLQTRDTEFRPKIYLCRCFPKIPSMFSVLYEQENEFCRCCSWIRKAMRWQRNTLAQTFTVLLKRVVIDEFQTSIFCSSVARCRPSKCVTKFSFVDRKR